MAAKIHSYYLKAEEIGGIKARAKLSMLTMIDSFQAKCVDDTDENIRKFEKAMKQIVKEFNKGNSEESLRLKVLKMLMASENI